ncbi:hypothetical protein JTB14_037376 [Gonioctena quinquepunctata]|nr:hypothetical protein JTB14_037376 [Gonioctena quinquepunctata]
MGKDYQGTNDETKFIFQIINEDGIAEVGTLRDERAKDLNIQRKSHCDWAKNRIRFQTTRIQTFRRVRRRFEGRNDSIKKLLKANERKVMDIASSCREFEKNTEGLLGLTKWSKSTEADSFPSRKRKPLPPLNESNKSCDENYLLLLFGTDGVFV